MKTSLVDVLVIGGGPAGLAAAIELKKSGVNSVRVLERERVAGGVPRHSFHPGYGLRDFKQFLSGPKYAKKYVDGALSAGVVISTLSTATHFGEKNSVQVTSPSGLEQLVHEQLSWLQVHVSEHERRAQCQANDLQVSTQQDHCSRLLTLKISQLAHAR